MRKFWLLALLALISQAGQAQAVIFSDDFESGVQGSIWTKWGGASQEILQTDSSHNITPAGSLSARAFQADPTAYNAYASIGDQSGRVKATVWLFEDFNNDGTNPAEPITNMLALIGAGTPGSFNGEYLQLGVVPFWPGGSQTYGFRTAYNDGNALGIIDTGVSRKAGWTKLTIDAAALSDGGLVQFFIDDVLVGSSQRQNTNLGFVRLGNNSKSYENFWYDDINVVPEPSSLLTLGIGSLALMIFRRRRS
jgi:hypothetical protein